MRLVQERNTRKAFLGENPELLAEHYIAEKLHMPVYKLRAEMPNDEYVRWTRYFAVKQQTAELHSRQAANRVGR
jgi:hypothetical protein